MKYNYDKHKEFMCKMHEKHHGHHRHDFEYGHHHEHFESGASAEKISDDTIKCLCCPNQCIMTVSKDGSITGNRCPRGAAAAGSIRD